MIHESFECGVCKWCGEEIFRVRDSDMSWMHSKSHWVRCRPSSASPVVSEVVA